MDPDFEREAANGHEAQAIVESYARRCARPNEFPETRCGSGEMHRLLVLAEFVRLTKQPSRPRAWASGGGTA